MKYSQIEVRLVRFVFFSFEIFSDLLIVVRGVRGAAAVVPIPVQPGQILHEAVDVVPGDSPVGLVLVFLLPPTQQQETRLVLNQTGRSAVIRVKLSRGDQNQDSHKDTAT